MRQARARRQRSIIKPPLDCRETLIESEMSIYRTTEAMTCHTRHIRHEASPKCRRVTVEQNFISYLALVLLIFSMFSFASTSTSYLFSVYGRVFVVWIGAEASNHQMTTPYTMA